MINFASEQPYGAMPSDKNSPCWLDTERKKGILDALSKHFMLAQGPETSIMKFSVTDESVHRTWTRKEVAYAGEILVDLRTCTYIVTEESGTYRPNGGFRTAVNEHFAKKLHDQDGDISLPNVIEGCQHGLTFTSLS